MFRVIPLLHQGVDGLTFLQDPNHHTAVDLVDRTNLLPLCCREPQDVDHLPPVAEIIIQGGLMINEWRLNEESDDCLKQPRRLLGGTSNHQQVCSCLQTCLLQVNTHHLTTEPLIFNSPSHVARETVEHVLRGFFMWGRHTSTQHDLARYTCVCQPYSPVICFRLSCLPCLQVLHHHEVQCLTVEECRVLEHVHRSIWKQAVMTREWVQNSHQRSLPVRIRGFQDSGLCLKCFHEVSRGFRWLSLLFWVFHCFWLVQGQFQARNAENSGCTRLLLQQEKAHPRPCLRPKTNVLVCVRLGLKNSHCDSKLLDCAILQLWERRLEKGWCMLWEYVSYEQTLVGSMMCCSAFCG